MKRFLILIVLIAWSFCGFSQHRLFRYYNSHIRHHYYTTDFSEYGGERDGWQLEGSTCLVYTAEYKQGGIVPLFRYYNPTTRDHLYTTRFSELGNGGAGYNFEGPACYIYKYRERGTVPLLRYFNRSSNDHFYTIDRDELGRGGFDGYAFEGVVGYVFPNEN